jgi:hypothetical protein
MRVMRMGKLSEKIRKPSNHGRKVSDMQKATTWKGAAAAATIAALLYGGSGVYRSMQNATVGWFSLLED